MIRADARVGHQRAVGVETEDGVLVAMRLHQRVPRHLRRPPPRPAEQLRECDRRRCERGGALVVVHQFDRVPSQHGSATRLEPDDRDAVIQLRRQHVQRSLDAFLGGLELAGGDQGQAAAHRATRQHDLVPRGFQYRDRGAAHLWRKVIGEAVRPQQDRAAVLRGCASRPPVEPRRERLLGERGYISFGCDAAEPLRQCRTRHPVDQSRRLRRDPRHLRQPTHRPVRQRPCPWPAFVVVCGELRLVRRHVDVDRTVRKTALARQAQVERVADFG